MGPGRVAPRHATVGALPDARRLSGLRSRVFDSFLFLPLALAVAYLVLLALRFPQLAGWLNANGDVASAYVLAETVGHGATGHIVLGTQGAWDTLGFGVLTRGLSFHRALWETAPWALSVVSAAIVALTVRAVAGRAPALITCAILLAASPVGLITFAAPWQHNTTMLGSALLGAFLVWLHARRRRPAAIAAATSALALLTGTFLASDTLLVTEGLLPVLIVALLYTVRTGDRSRLGAIVALCAGSVTVAALTGSVMRRLGFATTAPPLRVDLSAIPDHILWVLEGLLRMGNGLEVVPEPTVRMLLTALAALATVAGLAVTLARTRASARAQALRDDPARAMLVLFWSAAVAVATGAYVLTAEVSSDRYFLVAIPAVAAVVPLSAGRRLTTRLVVAGATVFIAASTVALASSDARALTHSTVTLARLAQIERLVTKHSLGVGYAGYWDAAPLTWASHGRLQVHPITGVRGGTQPMNIARVAAWYRPRLHTPSYLVLAPGDDVLANRVPRDLPAPARLYRFGPFTLATYPYDIAGFLHQPSN